MLPLLAAEFGQLLHRWFSDQDALAVFGGMGGRLIWGSGHRGCRRCSQSMEPYT